MTILNNWSDYGKSDSPALPTAPSEKTIDLPSETRWLGQSADVRALDEEIARGELAEALTALRLIAELFCHEAWDAAQRKGQTPAQLTAKEIAALIVSELQRQTRLTAWSDPALGKKHAELLTRLAQIEAENARLRQDLILAQQTVTQPTRQVESLLKQGEKRSNRRDELRLAPHAINPILGAPGAPTESNAGATPVASIANAEPEKDAEDEMLKLIATNGICRGKEIKEQLALILRGEVRGAHNYQRQLNSSVTKGLLELTSVKLDRQGSNAAHVYRLTKVGKARAKALGVNTVESEYDKGLRHHTSGEHFYLILDARDALRQAGWTELSVFVDNIKFTNGEWHAPDIRGLDPGGQTLCVEVERDTTKDLAATSKKYAYSAVLNGGSIYVIVPNRSAMATVSRSALEAQRCYSQEIKRVFLLNLGEFDPAQLSWEELQGGG